MGETGEAKEPQAELITEATWVYTTGRFLTGTCLRLYNRLQVEGSEHLPAEGGALIVANHASFLDIPTIASTTRRHVSFVARDSLAKSRFLAWVMRESGVVLLRRGAADRRALREMGDHLKAGDLVTVFPEGTRSTDGSLGEFRPGAAFAARQSRVPIVPAAILGSFAAYPRGCRFPRPAKIRVRYGAPIASDHPEALEQARAAIAALLQD